MKHKYEVPNATTRGSVDATTPVHLSTPQRDDVFELCCLLLHVSNAVMNLVVVVVVVVVVVATRVSPGEVMCVGCCRV